MTSHEAALRSTHQAVHPAEMRPPQPQIHTAGRVGEQKTPPPRNDTECVRTATHPIAVVFDSEASSTPMLRSRINPQAEQQSAKKWQKALLSPSGGREQPSRLDHLLH